jgi:hypothetical protein
MVKVEIIKQNSSDIFFIIMFDEMLLSGVRFLNLTHYLMLLSGVRFSNLTHYLNGSCSSKGYDLYISLRASKRAIGSTDFVATVRFDVAI